MATILITGLLLIGIVLLIEAVSLLADRFGRDKSLPVGLVTIVPLYANDPSAPGRVRHLLHELRWLDETLVGQVLLVNMSLSDSDPLLEDCLLLCRQYEHLSLCSYSSLAECLSGALQEKSTG